MKQFLVISFLFLISMQLYSSEEYILCIDGGGSKTTLHILSLQGMILQLKQHEKNVVFIESSGSNINSVGVDGVRQSLAMLIDDVTMQDTHIKVRDVLPSCYVVACFAGLGDGNKSIVTKLFEELGIQEENLILTHDAELPLQLIQGTGAILIAGTGTICLGKKNDTQYRVGGLGYLLGDEGSGYALGLGALRAALAHEYGWGRPTGLTEALRKFYDVENLKTTMLDLYRGKITPAHIARTVPIICAQAEAHDVLAGVLIEDATQALCYLATTMAILGDLSHCEIHTWGGLFKSNFAQVFINAIEQHPIIKRRDIKLVNKAKEHAAVCFVQKYICHNLDTLVTLWQEAKKICDLKK